MTVEILLNSRFVAGTTLLTQPSRLAPRGHLEKDETRDFLIAGTFASPPSRSFLRASVHVEISDSIRTGRVELSHHHEPRSKHQAGAMDAGRDDNSLIHLARFTSSNSVKSACGTWRGGTGWTLDSSVVSCPRCIDAVQGLGEAPPRPDNSK